MASSVKEVGLAAIRTDLLGINAITPYNFKVEIVSRDVAPPERLKVISGDVAAIAMLDGIETKHRQVSNRVIVWRVPVTLLCYIKRNPDESGSATLNKLRSDVFIALYSSSKWNHSGNVILTDPLSFDPLAVAGVDLLCLIVDFYFLCSHTWDDPTTT